MISLTLSILVIISSWIFELPIAWAVTLTIFACLEIIITMTRIFSEANEGKP